jgi:hypothetical protein
LSNSNFQDIVEKLKKSVKDQNQANIPIEDQMKVIRRERERQERIDQEYSKRKEAAARELIEGMKALKDPKD